MIKNETSENMGQPINLAGRRYAQNSDSHMTHHRRIEPTCSSRNGGLRLLAVVFCGLPWVDLAGAWPVFYMERKGRQIDQMYLAHGVNTLLDTAFENTRILQDFF